MIRIAVLGPEDLTQRIMLEGERYELLSFVPMAYRNEKETVPLLSKACSKADIILFTGPVPFTIARRAGICTKPMYYVVCSTGALYGILLSYIEQNGWFKGRTFRISIDTLNHDSVETMLAEFGMNDHSIYAFDGSEVATEKELTEFHTALFRAGKTDFAVTGLTSAYHSLRAANIPAYRLAITKTAIHAALRLVELEARNLLIRDMQLCVGVVRLHYPENTQSSRVSDYEYRRRRLAFTNRFVDYCEDIKASIRIDDDNT